MAQAFDSSSYAHYNGFETDHHRVDVRKVRQGHQSHTSRGDIQQASAIVDGSIRDSFYAAQ